MKNKKILNIPLFTKFKVRGDILPVRPRKNLGLKMGLLGVF
jgi:hypothetical protein